MENSQNIDRTHNYLLEDERKILEVLRVTLEKAESFCASSQYSLLSLVHNILLGGIPNEETMLSLSSNLLDGLIKDFGWELFDYIHPFLISTNGSIEECSKVRKVASSILSHIGDVYSFRDLHMIVCERLSFIDWDTCFPDEEACLKSAIQSVEIFKQLGKVFERATGTKRIDDFILYPVKYCARTLSFLERILCDFSSFGLSKHKQSRWDDILLTLTNSILDFIEYGSKLVFNTDQMQQCKPETFESNDMMRRRYLFVYLLALLFEKIILNLDMELSKKYYSRFHSRYNIRTPSQTQEIHQSSTKKKSSLVSDMIFRSTVNINNIAKVVQFLLKALQSFRFF
ncbi:hypothetical protein J3Q64DRAFT_1765145 [Phycomyces blakesleeanus]|uniref:Uncharacterized protein n=1 Tax=Phycomyces blakesleeanus TaxID=4837 RepID=A0ABR3AN64_PHYBL